MPLGRGGCQPTQSQENLLRRTIGCVRLIYNKALAARTQAWHESKERVGYKQTSAMLTNWKKQEDLDFLKEVSSVPLQQGGSPSTNSFYQLL
ncbi:hypothetical protein CYANOKiyG1_47030 [Okeania sp. KiyG1]|nr:hypothetical protein CYANOKiyG1_47030 [Okeania sp. KiyG1]